MLIGILLIKKRKEVESKEQEASVKRNMALALQTMQKGDTK